jgi:regulation of enolase protein 1 (concanavalin A-like superfamily)
MCEDTKADFSQGLFRKHVTDIGFEARLMITRSKEDSMSALPARVVAALFPGLAGLILVFSACHSWTHPVAAQDGAKEPPVKKEAADEKTIRALIADLGDDAFDKRQAAEKRLAAMGEAALAPLEKAAKENADAEVRDRAERVIRAIEHQRFRVMLRDKQWGNLVDPDHDCTFRVDKEKLHIKIPPKTHILATELGTVNAPRVLRDFEGDFHAEVTVQGAIPSDPRSLVDGRWPFYGAGLLVWQDERNYIRLERARMYYVPEGIWRCYVDWELRRNGQVERWGRYGDGVLDQEIPTQFRLDRKADAFTASYSQDGKEWKQLPPMDVDFGKKLSVGVAAIQNTPAGYEATFEKLKVVLDTK